MDTDHTLRAYLKEVHARAPVEYILVIMAVIVIIAALIIYYLKKIAPLGKLRITTDKTEIQADGESKSTITIQLLNMEGKPMEALEDTKVELKTTGGDLESEVVKIPKGKDSAQTSLTSSKEAVAVNLEAKGKRLKKDKMKITFLEKARFCMHCGTNITTHPLKDGKCPKCKKTPTIIGGDTTKKCQCGAEVPAKMVRGNVVPLANYCSQCGASQPKQGE